MFISKSNPANKMFARAVFLPQVSQAAKGGETQEDQKKMKSADFRKALNDSAQEIQQDRTRTRVRPPQEMTFDKDVKSGILSLAQELSALNPADFTSSMLEGYTSQIQQMRTQLADEGGDSLSATHQQVARLLDDVETQMLDMMSTTGSADLNSSDGQAFLQSALDSISGFLASGSSSYVGMVDLREGVQGIIDDLGDDEQFAALKTELNDLVTGIHSDLADGTDIDQKLAARADELQGILDNSADVAQASGGSYNFSGGTMVIEAENFTGSAAGSNGQEWVESSEQEGFLNGTGVTTSSNTGANMGSGTDGARLDYTINFEQATDVRVWVRMYQRADTHTNNSVHLGLDGTKESGGFLGVTTQESSSTPGPEGWHWVSMAGGEYTDISVTEAGSHELNMWMREDGTIIDRVMISDDLSFDPNAVDEINPTNPSTNQTVMTADHRSSLEALVAAAESAGPAGEVQAGQFKTVDGMAVIEAEELTSQQTGAGGMEWEAGVSDGASGQVLTTENNGFNGGTGTDGARADYEINFEEAGEYKVWVRMYQQEGTHTSNSVHLGLNGEKTSGGGLGVTTQEQSGVAGPEGWKWVSVAGGEETTIQVDEAGTQTLNMWVREDGTIIDQVMVSKDLNFDPNDTGIMDADPYRVTTGGGESGSAYNADVTYQLQQIQSALQEGTSASMQEAYYRMENLASALEQDRAGEGNAELLSQLQAGMRSLEGAADPYADRAKYSSENIGEKLGDVVNGLSKAASEMSGLQNTAIATGVAIAINPASGNFSVNSVSKDLAQAGANAGLYSSEKLLQAMKKVNKNLWGKNSAGWGGAGWGSKSYGWGSRYSGWHR